jgi:mono/diheme cytochrome c family protein
MRHCFLSGLLAALLVCTWGVALGAQQPPPEKKPTIKVAPAAPTKTFDGVDSYDSYCAVCHGKSGKGDGPAAPALKAPLPDLTTISQRHNGVFPRKDVEETITGIHRPAVHGTEDMPLWGPVFRKLSSNNFATLRLHNLLDYLEKMQVK